VHKNTCSCSSFRYRSVRSPSFWPPPLESDALFHFLLICAIFVDDFSTGFYAPVHAPALRVPVACCISVHEYLHHVADDFVVHRSIRIQLISFDDGSNQNTALIRALDLIQSRNVTAILGPASSSSSQTVAPVCNAFSVPQISYSSSNPSLSDKSLYPWFFRTCPSDALQGAAWVSALRHFKWEACAVISTSDAYGSGASNVLLNLAPTYNISVLRSTQFSVNTPSTGIIANVRSLRDSGAKVIVIAAVFADARNVLIAAYGEGMLGPKTGYTWILSEAAAVESLFRAGDEWDAKLKAALPGSIGTRPVYGSGPLWDQFLSIWNTKNATEYTGARAPITDGYAPYVIDGLYAFAYAADALIKNNTQPRGIAFFNALKAVSFSGVTGTVRFDKNLDRPSDYEILNCAPDTYEGGVTGSFWRTVGRWSGIANEVTFTDESKLWWPNGAGPANLPVDGLARERYYIRWDSAYAIVVAIITALLLALMIFTIVVIILRRDTPVMRHASVSFLITMVIGFMLLYVSQFFWFADPTPALCNLRVWFGFMGYVLAYGSLLGKTFRIYRIFSANKKLVRTVITDAQLVPYIIVITGIQLVILILWVSLNPFTPIENLNGAKTLYNRGCGTDAIVWPALSLAYCGVLALVTLFLSFNTRKVPASFRETFWINNASFVILFIAAVAVAVGILIADNLLGSYVMATIGLLVGTTAAWGLLLGPKLYIAVIDTAKNVQAGTMSKMRSELNTSTSE
jgi:ABC-type branched-subunit amino acid transport system substrate-binding protein